MTYLQDLSSDFVPYLFRDLMYGQNLLLIKDNMGQVNNDELCVIILSFFTLVELDTPRSPQNNVLVKKMKDDCSRLLFSRGSVCQKLIFMVHHYLQERFRYTILIPMHRVGTKSELILGGIYLLVVSTGATWDSDKILV
jgi:hypothetical protein